MEYIRELKGKLISTQLKRLRQLVGQSLLKIVHTTTFFKSLCDILALGNVTINLRTSYQFIDVVLARIWRIWHGRLLSKYSFGLGVSTGKSASDSVPNSGTDGHPSRGCSHLFEQSRLLRLGSYRWWRMRYRWTSCDWNSSRSCRGSKYKTFY